MGGLQRAALSLSAWIGKKGETTVMKSADKTASDFFAQNTETFTNLLKLKESYLEPPQSTSERHALDNAMCKLLGQRAYLYWLEHC